MKNTGWIHPIDTSDQWDGFNESGMEHFTGSPIRHLAREVTQNSLDSKSEHGNGCVQVRIRKRTVKVNEIPGIDELKATFKLCGIAASAESEKAAEFFQVGLKELSKSKINILEIEDFNTKGIRGPAKNGSPYYAFMKAKGQSKKESATAGGSFGIGKFAPYAVSKLRTVFVSTVFSDDDGEFKQLTQGKSILMSHDGSNGERHQGIGFWGVTEKCNPVEDEMDKLPSWLTRCPADESLSDHVGTKLTILGFDDVDGWQKSLAVTLAENFFGAINEGSLEINIDGAFELNATTLDEVFENEELMEHIENDKNEPDQFINSHKYHKCVSGHEGVFLEQHQNLHLGLCELKIYVEEGLPKKVAFLRNGMFISDSLSLPGLKKFSDFKDFVAVLQCKDAKGITLLRKMEPPRHDDFEPQRLTNKDEQAKAIRALRELASWIRDMLKKRAKDPVSDVTKIDELKEFFADDSDSGQGNASEEVNPFGKIVITANPVATKKPKSVAAANGETGPGPTEQGDSGGGGGDDGEGGGDSESGGAGTSGSGGGTGQTKPSVSLANLRAVTTSSTSRRIAFTPISDGQVVLSLFEVGADSDYPVMAKATSSGHLKDGRIEMMASKGVRQILEVELAEDFEGAIKVVAHEV